MRKIIAILMILGLLLFSVAAMAQEETPEEEKLLTKILDLEQSLKEAIENKHQESAYYFGLQLKEAKEDYERYLEKREAIEEFGGVKVGVGYAMMFYQGSEKLIEEAELVNGIVRIKSEGNIQPKILAEIHYYFVIDCESNGKWGIGPFVGLTNNNQPFDALAIGCMVGFRRLGEVSPRSLNLGIGWVWDRTAKMLGDGIEANKPLPAGEVEIRYKNNTIGGLIFVASFSF